MNNTQSGKVNILPIVLIVFLILGAGYLLTKGEIKIPGLRNDNTIEVRRLNGFPTIVQTNKVIEKQRLIIKSQDELNNFLNLIDPSGFLTLKEDIDFDKEYLLAASTKTLTKSDTSLKIKKVYQDKKNNTLIVSIRQGEFGDACTAEDVSNIAADIVAVSKTNKNITFEILKETQDCDK